MQMIFGYDEALAEWASKQIPIMRYTKGFGPCRSIGVGLPEQDKLYAAIVYHDYMEFENNYKTCQISIAAVNPRWATRGIIRALLSVPFEQYGINKLWCFMESTNHRAIKFNKGIGFKQEATLGHHFGKNRGAVITRMLKSDYDRIYGDGRVLSKTGNIVNFPCIDMKIKA